MATAFVDGPRLIEAGKARGPLARLTFAAKDIFDVAGTPTGAGNPAWTEDAKPAAQNATIIEQLLEAGASLMGKTHTDELAWSVSGTNAHYGTPPNPAAPDRVPGGSSSGSASAVAAGSVDIGLGSDTGGSIRVPASYCGICGFRPTHGRLSTSGMIPLAPSFDTPGFMTRTPDVLREVWRAIGPPTRPRPVRRLLVATDFGPFDASGLTETLGLEVERAVLADDLDGWLTAFRVLQSAEVWANHGAWLVERNPPLGPGVASRVKFAQALTTEDVAAAQPVRDAVKARLRLLLGDDAVMALPAAPGPAHTFDLDGEAKHAERMRILRCTITAPLAGAPSVALPIATSVEGLPVGVCLLGLPGDDDLLLDLAQSARLA